MRWGHWGKGRGGGPREWRRKKDWIDSQVSTVRRTLSRTSSLHLGPYSMCPCAQLLPAPYWSETRCRESNSSPSGPESVDFSTPSSVSISTARARSEEICEPTGSCRDP